MTDLPPLAFCLSLLDRGEDIRRDAEALAGLEQHAEATAIPFFRAQPAMTPDRRMLRLPLAQVRGWPQAGPLILLGLDEGAPLYALDLDPDADLPGELDIVEPRAAALRMPIEETGIFAQARSLIEWRRKHRFCSNCGAATEQSEAGRKRNCPACNTEHFPRIDPVAIMLVVKDDWCLLGRQEHWPPRMWSALAGFMEPGETIADAAAREVWEEAGIQCNQDSVEILDNQPWPFPSSLMIGLVIEAVTVGITVDPHELEQARWFSREEVIDMLSGTHPEADVPDNIAIATRLLKIWAARG